ncbi:unnamed protein product [Cylindrotheca closterium]|uniref:Oxidation resistance protein 1 n=1 Tax=Cylindrotheca closterium TaxID=2856 RepID=A0AAD2FSK0_9STRA|nr:unnamed protein product [Cylindrotheca closterium]
MNVIQRFDFLEVSRTEDLIFPEKILALGRRTLDRDNDNSYQEDNDVVSSTRNHHSKVLANTSSDTRPTHEHRHHHQRHQLKVRIEEMRHSLAPMELAVLEGIVEQGNDAQVDLAHERLKRAFPSTLENMMVINNNSSPVVCKDASSTHHRRHRHHRHKSSVRRVNLLMQRQENNATHNGMFQAMIRTRWQNAGKKVIYARRLLQQQRGRHVVSPGSIELDGQIATRGGNVRVQDNNWPRQHERRTKTPAEMKDIALLAINAAAIESAGLLEIETSRSAENNNAGIVPNYANNAENQTYDPWEKVDEDFTGVHFDFHIIGTSATDSETMPHVLSPPVMHRLQEALPYNKKGESFWLKYSLVRDGASLTTFLNKMRGTKHAILAIETVEGEVFGAFTGEPWHLDLNYYGSSESFVWRMRHHRGEISESIAEQAKRESEIDIFGYNRSHYENSKSMVQLCQSHPSCRLAIGGGSCHYPRGLCSGEIIQPYQWGFSIAFDDNCLLEGTTSPSITFLSPSLSEFHSDGSKFEVLNLEGWALTPCVSVGEAEIMECRKTFLERESLR